MAKSEKDPKSPATTSDDHDFMLPTWSKISAVLGGTETMRAASRALLPQHEKESDKRYAERLLASTLFNMTQLTLDSWVGRPFSDPIKLDKIPSEIEEINENVDLEGNDLQVFARGWFKEGLGKAFSHVLVDFPRKPEGQLTAADDEKLRPYWVRICPEDLIFAEAVVVDGEEKLVEIRMKETIYERIGFAMVAKRQIRRMILVADPLTEEERGRVEIYKPVEKKKGAEEWMLVEAYPFDLDVIPLVTFYADRESFMRGKPPIKDLADLSVTHWQSSSDQRSILTVARFPILAATGVADEKKIVVGPYNYLYSSDANGKFYYVEHTGGSIEAGRSDIKDLEDKMSEYGADFLRKRPGGETATARALDSAEATSPLQDVTLRFNDALENALALTAKWLGIEFDGSAELTTDFGPEVSDPNELLMLKEARVLKDISRETFLDEMSRRGVLSEEFDQEKNDRELEQEKMEFGGDVEDDDDPDEDIDPLTGKPKVPAIGAAA